MVPVLFFTRALIGNYKIPGFRDVPKVFNVRILKNGRNSRAIHSSKAVGEPPLFLGASVYFAIRHALGTPLDSPATCERIRMAVQDDIVALCLEPGKGKRAEWSTRA